MFVPQQYVPHGSPPTVPPPLPSRLREQWERRAAPTAAHNKYYNFESLAMPQDDANAFQLPPDGVYESISQIKNLRLMTAPVNVTADEDKIVHTTYEIEKPPLLEHYTTSLPQLSQNIVPASLVARAASENVTSSTTIPGRAKKSAHQHIANNNTTSECNINIPIARTPRRNHASQSSRTSLASRTSLTPRVSFTPRTPGRKTSRVSLYTPGGASKNGVPPQGRGVRTPSNRTPSHRPHNKYRARDVLHGKGE